MLDACNSEPLHYVSEPNDYYFLNVHMRREVARRAWRHLQRVTILVGKFAREMHLVYDVVSSKPGGQAYIQAAKRFKCMQA
jgi:hypothetical protein